LLDTIHPRSQAQALADRGIRRSNGRIDEPSSVGMTSPRDHYGVSTGWAEHEASRGSEPGLLNPMTWLTGLVLLAIVAAIFAAVPALGVLVALGVLGFGGYRLSQGNVSGGVVFIVFGLLMFPLFGLI
jgi:hypothetical protein